MRITSAFTALDNTDVAWIDGKNTSPGEMLGHFLHAQMGVSCWSVIVAPAYFYFLDLAHVRSPDARAVRWLLQ
jgi:hypothetical protein